MRMATAADLGRAVARRSGSARRRACEPVSASSLAAFRIAFGLLAVVGALRFLAKGWVGRLYLEPVHHLTYTGLEWARPLPGFLAYAHVALLAVLGVAIAVGYRHRVAAGLYAVASVVLSVAALFVALALVRRLA